MPQCANIRVCGVPSQFWCWGKGAVACFYVQSISVREHKHPDHSQHTIEQQQPSQPTPHPQVVLLVCVCRPFSIVISVTPTCGQISDSKTKQTAQHELDTLIIRRYTCLVRIRGRCGGGRVVRLLHGRRAPAAISGHVQRATPPSSCAKHYRLPADVQMYHVCVCV